MRSRSDTFASRFSSRQVRTTQEKNAAHVTQNTGTTSQYQLRRSGSGMRRPMANRTTTSSAVYRAVRRRSPSTAQGTMHAA